MDFINENSFPSGFQSGSSAEKHKGKIRGRQKSEVLTSFLTGCCWLAAFPNYGYSSCQVAVTTCIPSLPIVVAKPSSVTSGPRVVTP